MTPKYGTIALNRRYAGYFHFSKKFIKHARKNIKKLRVDFPEITKYDVTSKFHEYINSSKKRSAPSVIKMIRDVGINESAHKKNCKIQLVEMDEILLDYVIIKEKRGEEYLSFDYETFWEDLISINLSLIETVEAMNKFIAAKKEAMKNYKRKKIDFFLFPSH